MPRWHVIRVAASDADPTRHAQRNWPYFPAGATEKPVTVRSMGPFAPS